MGVLPLLILGGYSLKKTAGFVREEAERELFRIAENLVFFTHDTLDDLLASLSLIVDLTSESQSLEDYKKRVSYILTHHRDMEGVVIEDTESGRILYVPWERSFGREGIYFRRVWLKGRDVWISRPFISTLTQETAMIMTVPFMDIKISVYLNLMQLQEVISKIQLQGSTQCMVTTLDNTIVVHSHRKEVLSKIQSEDFVDMWQIQQDARGFLYKKDNVLWLGVEREVRPLGWKAMALIPLKEALGLTYYLAKVSMAGLALSLIIAMGLALLLVTRIVRPFTSIMDAMRRVSSGQYEIPQIPYGYKEIGELVRDLEVMANLLREREQAIRDDQQRYMLLYEEYRSKLELYHTLLDTAPDPIVIYDEEGNVQYVNHSFENTFGWGFEELKGKRVPYVPEEEREHTLDTIRRVLNGEVVKNFQGRRFSKDGRLLDIELSSSAYRDHQGRIKGILVILRDVTEQKRLEAQFFAAQKMESIGTLAGGIAHNFNNILMGIQGNAYLISMNLPPTSPVQEKVATIQELVKRGARLTSLLLGFARGGKYQVKLLDLNSIVRRIVPVFCEGKEGLQMKLELAQEISQIEGDESQMEQIILNLLQNAWEAMPSGGVITVGTKDVEIEEGFSPDFTVKAGRYVCISVADTGIGMDEEVKRRIFEPFFTTKGLAVSTGLGLSAVYGIVKNHGGFIMVESKKGEGSVFKVYIPGVLKAQDEKGS